MARGSLIGQVVVGVFLVVLVAGAAFEAALAVGLLDVGPLPGQMPRGAWLVDAAYVTLFFGGLILVIAGAGVRVAAAFTTPTLPFVSLAAAGFTVARFYSYDDYAPESHLRVSEVSDFPAWWIAVVVVVAAAVAVVAWKRPRAGVSLVGAVMLLAAGTLFAVGPWR